MMPIDRDSGIKSLSGEAENRFEKIRERLGLNFGIKNSKVSTNEFKTTAYDKFEDAITRAPANRKYTDIEFELSGKSIEEFREETKKELQAREYIDGVFSFINSLNLPPNLACAIGYIISYKKTNDIAELEMAVEVIEKELDTINL